MGRPNLTRTSIRLHLRLQRSHSVHSFAEDPKREAQASAELAVDVEREREIEKLSQGMTLLLAARDRVLTLSEQRVCPIYATFLS